ncbi:acetyl-CoA synthetase [Klebsormidium nitens]|uniref:Acetyl-coenzyme A synthetase n=1 Tax=Klebsormidium nitens TaxID=105231 RepID=A0A1Y1II17_KLENI|nr:acetyl-CoA synthetase [Klebsormidium nitens]|eukprot:GAQ89149.1 acetyl-CoA synthetase [Klebsormidium nitens]
MLASAHAARRVATTLRHLVPYTTSRSTEAVQDDVSSRVCSSAGGDKPHGKNEAVDVGTAFHRNHWPHILSRKQYEAMYRWSVEDPQSFWGSIAAQLHWERPWDKGQPICSYNFNLDKGPIYVKWFPGGRTNVCFNALDRHVLSGNGNKAAILFEGNDVGIDRRLTYQNMLELVCQIANYLRSLGVKKGDTVCIYMPMVPELPATMLACARIGAIHSVVFGGFSAESLAGRMSDCRPKLLVTCNAVRRGAKVLNLKEIADKALELCEKKEGVRVGQSLVFENANATKRSDTAWKNGRDVWWQDVIPRQSKNAPVEWMDSEDPLFMLYTSGSTGKPKGVMHTVGGYMVYAATTFKFTFDYHDDDVFWCTADCGWITGHTYLAYGPLLNGATCVVFEGVPTYPDAGRCWQIVDKYKVSIFYTAPTAIRSMEKEGDRFVKKYSRKSLRVLGTVGEPINPKAWWWYFDVVGDGRCPIVDTWWQTETGGNMISPMAGAWDLKPGSATLPFFGVQPVLLDEKGREKEGATDGNLCIKAPWPGIARTLFGDHERFQQTYFSTYKGYYVTGDGARRDEDGYIWLTGRTDDVINVSGHRISTSEVEAALNAHPACAESAVVGFDHEKGVRSEIGGFAAPDVIHWATGLPKTRSGKIMRRILRKIAANKLDELGDVSSLADPSVIDALIKLKGK